MNKRNTIKQLLHRGCLLMGISAITSSAFAWDFAEHRKIGDRAMSLLPRYLVENGIFPNEAVADSALLQILNMSHMPGSNAHAWPGNVRELKQKIQTAVLQSEGDMITEADLELDNEPSATSACFTLKSGDEERGRILRALKQAAGNKKMAAKILGIGRTTLYNKLVEYGLNEEN